MLYPRTVIDHHAVAWQMRERGLQSVLVLHEQADDKTDAVPCDQLPALNNFPLRHLDL